MIKIPEMLVFLDVETTGLDAASQRIIEVFLLAVEGSGAVREYETLINPQRPLPAAITALTGLTDQDLVGAPLEEEVAGEIREFIGTGTPVAHNLPFDRRFLNALFQRNGLTEMNQAGLDTLALSRELFPRLCVYPQGGGSHRLGNLMYHFELEETHANAHRAKDDVLLLVEVFRRLQAYAAGRLGLEYPAAVTHGCPLCGAAMQLEIVEGERILFCRNQPGCSGSLVI